MVVGKLARSAWIATPFALLAVGGYALWRSPWPSIWRLMEKGDQVRIAYTWYTVGLPGLSAACFAAAVAISLTIRQRQGAQPSKN